MSSRHTSSEGAIEQELQESLPAVLQQYQLQQLSMSTMQRESAGAGAERSFPGEQQERQLPSAAVAPQQFPFCLPDTMCMTPTDMPGVDKVRTGGPAAVLMLCIFGTVSMHDDASHCKLTCMNATLAPGMTMPPGQYGVR
jgi:hypothetical protein